MSAVVDLEHARGAATGDIRLECAVLELLETRPEIYPAHLGTALRDQDAALAIHGLGDVLEKLFREQRVARLWHRYMLPGDVGAVRRKWLAAIDRRTAGHDEDTDAAVADGRLLLQGWDGWTLDACRAVTDEQTPAVPSGSKSDVSVYFPDWGDIDTGIRILDHDRTGSDEDCAL